MRAQIGTAVAELRRHPRDASANAHFGMEMLTYQFPDAAEIAFRRAHLLEPREFGWLYLHAMTLVNRDDNKPAVNDLREAIGLRPAGDPAVLPARLALADSLLRLGRNPEAATEYRQLLSGEGNSPRANYGLGKALEMQGRYVEAAESYRQACLLFPRYGAAYFSLASVYRKLDQDADRPGSGIRAAEAMSFRQTAGDAGPPLGDPMHDPWLAAVLESNESSVILIQRGLAAARQGDFRRAIQLHEQVIDWEPADFDAHVNLVGFYTTVGDPVRAEFHYRAAAAIHPDDARLLNFHAMLLASQKRYVEALQVLKGALLGNPKMDDLQYNLGYLLDQQGHKTEALSHFRDSWRWNDKQRAGVFTPVGFCSNWDVPMRPGASFFR